jgi:hypothetical protein
MIFIIKPKQKNIFNHFFTAVHHEKLNKMPRLPWSSVLSAATLPPQTALLPTKSTAAILKDKSMMHLPWSSVQSAATLAPCDSIAGM